jgi:hypothetical protein
MAVKVTFIGGEGENVATTVWEIPGQPHRIEFPIRVPVLLDPETAGGSRDFVEHVIKKARTNRFFKVTDVREHKAKGAPDGEQVAD